MRARREKPVASAAKSRPSRDRRDTATQRRTVDRRPERGDRGTERGAGRGESRGEGRRPREERATPRRVPENPARKARAPRARGVESARGKRPAGAGPETAPMRRVKPATSTSQAKARAKARKAKAPKVVRPPLKERFVARLASIDLRPRTLAAKVPFVVLVIGSLGVGLAVTLWLSTDAAERSYELGNAREKNRALAQQKEALERDVLQAQSAPALAEAARSLGMIPSKDTAHLVQDPEGNWIVIGDPKPADGVPPPPLNSRLPDPAPPARPVDPREVPVRIGIPGTPGAAVPPGTNPEVPVLGGPAHAPAGVAAPGPALPGAQPPVGQVPAGQVPAGQVPVAQPPTGEPPAAQLPPAQLPPAQLPPAAPPAVAPPAALPPAPAAVEPPPAPAAVVPPAVVAPPAPPAAPVGPEHFSNPANPIPAPPA